VTDQDETVRDLAALVRAVLFGDRTATVYAERVASRLGIGEDDSADVIGAGLRTVLGAAAVVRAAGLGERVTAVLTAAGFTDSRDFFPGAFLIAEGAGATATVSVPWTGETDAARMLLLAGFALALRKDGLKVTDRGRYLDVRARIGDRP
jgi:hypothetical protein